MYIYACKYIYIYIYIYMCLYVYICIYICNEYMYIHVTEYGNGAAYMRRKQTYIFVLSVKPSAVLKLLK